MLVHQTSIDVGVPVGSTIDRAATAGPAEIVLCVSSHGLVASRCLGESPDLDPAEQALVQALGLPEIRLRGGDEDHAAAVFVGPSKAVASILTRPSRVEALRLWVLRNDLELDGHRVRALSCATRHR